MTLDRGDPGPIGTEPQVRHSVIEWFLAAAILVTTAVVAFGIWATMSGPPRPRPTCPDGYALVSDFASKSYCAPGLVEPVRR